MKAATVITVAGIVGMLITTLPACIAGQDPRQPPKPVSAIESDSANAILALDEQMEAMQHANDPARASLWADDLVYIGANGRVHDKASIAQAVAAGDVKTESLDVTDRQIRAYGDVAIVTATERVRASFHNMPPADFVQHYTRVWARRDNRWQVVSFQSSRVTDKPVTTVTFESCASAPNATPPKGSVEETILNLEEEHRASALSGNVAHGSGWLADDYVAVSTAGIFGKAYAVRQFDPGGLTKRLDLKMGDMQVRPFGNVAIVTGIWCTKTLRDGKVTTGGGRYTRIWVKRNGKWDVVNWQITPISPTEAG